MSYNMSEFPLIRSHIQEKSGKYPAGAVGKLDKLDKEQLAMFLTGLRQIMRFLPNSFTPCIPISKAQHDLLLCAANYTANDPDPDREEYISAEWAAWHLGTDVETVFSIANELNQKGLVEKITLKRGDDPKKAAIIPAPYGIKVITGTVCTVYEIMNSAVKDFSDEELSEYISLQNKFLDNFSKEETFMRINRAI